jgi:hypothetical protein
MYDMIRSVLYSCKMKQKLLPHFLKPILQEHKLTLYLTVTRDPWIVKKIIVKTEERRSSK